MKTNEFDKPREIPVKPQTTLTPKEIDDRVEKAKEKLHKKPEPFDFSKLWNKDEPRYEEFLQNKLDQAMQEYDSPEKKAQRDALMKQYLAKGGKVQKVPAGQTAYKGKELKPAFKKDNGTPITSPGSDESVERKPSDKQVRQAKGIAFDKRYKGGNYTGAHNTIEKLKKGLTKHPDVADALKRANEDAPFGSGMELLRMAIMKKFITVQEWDLLKHKWKDAAAEVEQRYADWPDGEGFGSSDHNFAIRDLMTAVGYEFDDQDTSGRFVVTKQPEEIEQAGIKNARMRDAVAQESEPSADAERADIAQGMWMASKELQAQFRSWEDFLNSEDFDEYIQDQAVTEHRGLIGTYAHEKSTGRLVRIVDYTDDDEGIYTISYGEDQGETDVTAGDLEFIDPTVNQDLDDKEIDEAPIEQDRDNPIAKPYVDTPEWKALHDMDDKIIQAYIKHKEVAEADGLQPADLKRLGQNEPKVYVHKDGKTIMVPRKQAHNYIAKGWKKSALRAETSYESKLADMLNQRLK